MEAWSKYAEEIGIRFILGRSGTFRRFVYGNGREEPIGIETADGQVFNGDKIIVAGGAWSQSFVPELMPLMEAHGQAVIHIPIPNDSIDRFLPNNFPPFAWDIAETGVYGFPAMKRASDGHWVLKLAKHASGFTRLQNVAVESGEFDSVKCSVPITTEDDPNLTIPKEIYGFVVDNVILPFLPELETSALSNLLSFRMCWYNDVFDGNFLLSPLPHEKYGGRVFVCTGGSGHAFKFAPVLGEMMAQVVEGREEPWVKQMFGWRSPTCHQRTAERCVDVAVPIDLSQCEMLEKRTI
jgi:sarcosine oxidase/L-pipecolate oxidase